MYTQKVKSKLTPKKLIALVIALLVVGAFIALESSGTINLLSAGSDSGSVSDKDNHYPATTEEERQQIDEDKTDPSKTPPANKPPSSDSAEAKISSASQSSGGADVVIQTQLSGSGWKNCKLILTRGTGTVTKTSETVYQQSFSTCLGFSIPASEFSTSGEWQARLEATKLDGTTVSGTKSVTVLK